MTTLTGYSELLSNGEYSFGYKAPIRDRQPPTPSSRSVDEIVDDPETDELQGAWKRPGIQDRSRKFATAALTYLQEQGHNFQLVKLGFYEGAVIGNGALFHYNFKAKPADDSSAPVETFFAQMRYFRSPTTKRLERLTVNCCVSLGNSDSLPDERDNCGCRYCTKFVYHPVDGCPGILWGSPEKDELPRKRKRKRKRKS